MNTPPPSILGAHPFLHGLAQQHVTQLAAHARSVRLPDKQRLFEEGRAADRFWLLQAGQVALDSMIPGRGRVIIEYLGRGDVVGMSWLFPPYQWGYGVITTQPLQAFEFDAKAIRAELEQDPALGHEITQRFLRVTVNRLQATRARLIDVSAYPELLPWRSPP